MADKKTDEEAAYDFSMAMFNLPVEVVRGLYFTEEAADWVARNFAKYLAEKK